MQQKWQGVILSLGLKRPYTHHSQNPVLPPCKSVLSAAGWEDTGHSWVLQLSGLRPQTHESASARSGSLTRMSRTVQPTLHAQTMINGDGFTPPSFGGSLVCYVAIDHWYRAYGEKQNILLLNSKQTFSSGAGPLSFPDHGYFLWGLSSPSSTLASVSLSHTHEKLTSSLFCLYGLGLFQNGSYKSDEKT